MPDNNDPIDAQIEARRLLKKQGYGDTDSPSPAGLPQSAPNSKDGNLDAMVKDARASLGESSYVHSTWRAKMKPTVSSSDGDGHWTGH